MRVIRVQAKQGHAVPSSWQASRGPFPPELFREPESVVEFTELDDMGQEVNEGATAQNAFKAPKLFRCKFCEVVVSEYHLEEHYCVEGEEANGDSAS